VAERAHELVPESLPTASTAVLFFHQHASLRQATTEVQALLKRAKQNVVGKHGLAVGYLRRSGVRDASIQPWSSAGGGTSAGLFRLFSSGSDHRLSPRLVTDLERDADELRTLPDAVYAAELRRLVNRHTGGERGAGRDGEVLRMAEALVELGVCEQAEPQPDPPLPRPVHVARVGVFLRQEGR
jgi:CRISPR-associated protein Cmr2